MYFTIFSFSLLAIIINAADMHIKSSYKYFSVMHNRCLLCVLYVCVQANKVFPGC